MNLKFLFGAFCLCFFFSLQSRATVWYVDSANVGGFQNGSEWAYAFTNPQLAINAAADGDSVWIAKAIYQPAAGTSYSMKPGVKIFGGFLNTYTTFAQRDYQTNTTILQGGGNSVISNSGNNLTSTAILDGFTIMGGNAVNGGGMENYNSSPSISNCTFLGNASGDYGGAIYNSSSSPNINNCAFKLNSSSAIYNISSSSPIISNCTFNGNAGSAIHNTGNGASINGCSFIKNAIASASGGAIYNSGDSVTISNCSFNQDSAQYGGAIFNMGAGISITGCDFSENAAPSSNSFGGTGTSNIGYGGAIYNNGVGASIKNCTFSTNRSVFAGAIYNGGSGTTISHSTFNQNHSIFDGYSNNSYGGAIYSKSKLNIDSCTFSGNSTVSITLSYGGSIYNSDTLTLSNCAFTGNLASSMYYPGNPNIFGGAVYSSAVLNASNCTFSGNSVAFSGNIQSPYFSYFNGGAIYSNGTSTGLNHCVFTGNFASTMPFSNPPSMSGGALYTTNSTSVDSCTFNNNSVLYGGGGAIYSNTAKLNISGSSFSNNSAIKGGAVNKGGGTLSIINSTFSANSAISSSNPSYGGAIYNDVGSTTDFHTFVNCLFTNNSAKLGGAIYNNQCQGANIAKNCNFSLNKATAGSGGAMYNDATNNSGALFNTSNCIFTGNKASLYGGGIYDISTSNNMNIANCSFSVDSAKNGAGIYNDNNSSPIITNALFSQNIADSVGGAIYNYASSPKMINCTIVRNKANSNGSGMYNINNSAPLVSNTILWGNYSGIYSDVSSIANTKYSLIQGYPNSVASHLIAGTTNPLFVDTASGNYQLQSASPCINVGSNDSLPSYDTADLAGNARIYNTTVDMGAYEFGISTPLAINLLYFTGEVQRDNSILLQWQIAKDANIDFELQRSNDAKAFKNIYTGDAQKGGNNTFSYTDATPGAINYYRLKLQQESGEISYSNVVFFSVDSKQGTLIIYPNPTKGNITLVSSKSSSLLQTTATLTDVFGKVVKHVRLTSQSQVISLSDLNAGIYFLNTIDGGNYKIIKQ